MDNKSFGIGLVVASCVWITTIVAIVHMEHNPIIIEHCDLTEDDVIDTDFEQLMVNNRAEAYERGYYTCLQDTRPDLHMAFVSCIVQLEYVQGDEAFSAIVDAECAKRGLDAQDKEYLFTLLQD
jgi:hypothetical protein